MKYNAKVTTAQTLKLILLNGDTNNSINKDTITIKRNKYQITFLVFKKNRTKPITEKKDIPILMYIKIGLYIYQNLNKTNINIGNIKTINVNNIKIFTLSIIESTPKSRSTFF